jgi:polyisoprenyl-phosphate glycosyltransferase
MTIAAPRHAPALSVVVPCYDEAACLPEFLTRMRAACIAAEAGSFEIVLVNDGSRDDTWACIRASALTQPGVVGINLARNHGHQLAVTAGLVHARGERVLVIDADLQDPPELLGEMMRKMDEGYDVVYARRRARSGETAFKRWTAHVYYRALQRLSDVEIPRDAGDFRLMSRAIVDRLNAMPEQDRFLRGMVAWLGGRQTEVAFDRDPRYAGATGYSFLKMARLALAGLTGFSTAPLHLAAVLTLFGIALGIAFGMYSLAARLFGQVVPGWTSLALLIVAFSTAQLGCLAVISMYLGRIFIQVKQRPLFLVSEIAASEAGVHLAAAAPVSVPDDQEERVRAAGGVR